MTECFWCDHLYDGAEFDRCPKCASDTNTKEITVISEDQE